MDEKVGASPRKTMLSSASPYDLYKAAEAVVDAALWCHRLRGDFEVPEDARLSLIEAVYQDPTLTPHLFEEDLLDLSWC